MSGILMELIFQRLMLMKRNNILFSIFVLILILYLMPLLTNRGHIIDCVLVKRLPENKVVVFAQDRLCICATTPPVDHTGIKTDYYEIESYDIISAYQHYL